MIADKNNILLPCDDAYKLAKHIWIDFLYKKILVR